MPAVTVCLGVPDGDVCDAALGTVLSQQPGVDLETTADLPAAPVLSGTTSFVYDALGQLTQETSTRAGGYDFYHFPNWAGNLKGIRTDGSPDYFQSFYNQNNQQLSLGGYLSSSWRPDGTPQKYLAIDLASEPDVLFDPEQGMETYYTGGYGYRADGLRAWKEVGVPNEWGHKRTYYLYDGVTLIGEVDEQGQWQKSHTWGDTGLLIHGDEFLQFDLLGDVAHVMDGQGLVLDRQLYDAYGMQRSGGFGDFDSVEYGYRGQYGYLRDSAKLYLLTWRYYDPAAGRFITRDPIGYSGGANLYSYVESDPVGWVDPLGLFSLSGSLHHLDNMAQCIGECLECQSTARTGDISELCAPNSSPVLQDTAIVSGIAGIGLEESFGPVIRKKKAAGAFGSGKYTSRWSTHVAEKYGTGKAGDAAANAAYRASWIGRSRAGTKIGEFAKRSPTRGLRKMRTGNILQGAGRRLSIAGRALSYYTIVEGVYEGYRMVKCWGWCSGQSSNWS